MAKASSPSRTVAKSINQRLDQAKHSIQSWDESDASVESDETLTTLWSMLKNLEDVAEEVRKEVVEPEMEDRVDPGERLCGVHLIQSHRKYVEEDVETVIGRAANRGINYTEFVSLKATTLANNYPEIVTIQENEYTYFR